MTPRCAAAAAAAAAVVVSAVVLRRPTTEYTHPYSMMHRRLPTAGIEVVPQYHQLLVMQQHFLFFFDADRSSAVVGGVPLAPRVPADP